MLAFTSFYKMTPLRDAQPLKAESLQICDTPDLVANYLRMHIPTTP